MDDYLPIHERRFKDPLREQRDDGVNEETMKDNAETCPWCGAEMKISKKGNEYCSNICWEKEPYKTHRKEAQIEAEAIIESSHSDWGNRD